MPRRASGFCLRLTSLGQRTFSPGLDGRAAFICRLRRQHPRKAAFWDLLGDSLGVPAMPASPRLVH